MATEEHWAECSHFIPMQEPNLVIERLDHEVKAWEASVGGR